MSKTRCLIHIVFATKRREMTITENHKRDLYAYIYGIMKNNDCFVHRINGMPDHVHILADLHPTVALADLVKDVKQFSHKWIKNNADKFPMFSRWGEGYYAASLGINDLDGCKRYIINQESHHGGCNLLEEMKQMALVSGLTWHEDDWS